MCLQTLSSVELPVVIELLQESPAVGDGQRGAVPHHDLSLSLRVVQHVAKINHSGGEVQVGEVKLSVQLHWLRVSQVLDKKNLEVVIGL